jgi:hypothetical protein
VAAATAAPTTVPASTAATNATTPLAESAITQTVAEPQATVTATLSSTTALATTDLAATDAVIDPNLSLTATIIGPETSHPTQIWIDGDPTDWQVLRAFSKSQTTTLDAMSDAPDSAGCQVRFAGTRSTEDLGAALQFAYDTTHLYVSFLVKDDGYVASGDADRFDQGDALAVFLKLNLTADSTVVPAGEDEFQINFLPGAPKVGDKPTISVQKIGESAEPLAGSGASVAATPLDDGYFVEASLPWSSLGVTTPQTGEQLGVVASVGDNDTPASPQQECYLSSVATYKGGVPESWNVLVLE